MLFHTALLACLVHCSSDKTTAVEEETDNPNPETQTFQQKKPRISPAQPLPPPKTEENKTTFPPASLPKKPPRENPATTTPSKLTASPPEILTRHVRVAIPKFYDQNMRTFLLNRMKLVLQEASRVSIETMQTQFIFQESLEWNVNEQEDIQLENLSSTSRPGPYEPNTITVGLKAHKISKATGPVGWANIFSPFMLLELTHGEPKNIEDILMRNHVVAFIHEYLHMMGLFHIEKGTPSLMNETMQVGYNEDYSKYTSKSYVSSGHTKDLDFDVLSKSLIPHTKSVAFSDTCEFVDLEKFLSYLTLTEQHSALLEPRRFVLASDEAADEKGYYEIYADNIFYAFFLEYPQSLFAAHYELTRSVGLTMEVVALELIRNHRLADARKCLPYLSAIEARLKIPMDTPRSKCVLKSILVSEYNSLLILHKAKISKFNSLVPQQTNPHVKEELTQLRTEIEAEKLDLSKLKGDLDKLSYCDELPYSSSEDN